MGGAKKAGVAAGTTAGIAAAVAAWDLLQRKHSVLRNYPIVGHLRYLLEDIRPEVQQYFIERNTDGRPYDRDVRSIIYERAKGIHGEQAFGTERDVNRAGYEFLLHSVAPLDPPDDPPRVLIGGPDCSKPYSMALLNVSAMSFGALSANAIRALNKGSKLGGFAHDTGEGGLSPYHLENGGDLVWEIGSGYFSTRTKDGHFDPGQFVENSSHEQVKAVSLKLSQGAKPGIGGVLPAAKVSAEIARIRNVPQGQKCVSPPGHRVFSTPVELIEFIARMRELSGGKPAGFKLCVGNRQDVLAICKAILQVGTAPDFIIVDGSEGGTAAAPLEYEDHVGMPLTEGLMLLHNALVGTGLRDRIKLGASGKVATGSDIVKRMIQGADYTNAARAMMMAIGCIQSQRCHTDRCPVGVATQNPRRSRALDVADKSQRVYRYQQATVAEAMSMMASMGVRTPEQLNPHQLRRNVSEVENHSYAELYEWLHPGELLSDPPASWLGDWAAASADHFPSPYVGTHA
ncbi:FMN-binding glutamate synthase family protein [Microlunatus elymi]|uniref:FMN-binding glutamate synthase family protein n=1 Tax=Microlunatus elymi TaxID=2596828 RepID=A0A516PUM8_9ACTN|nr:FMN-binding glutamate synthase family protein [Microlunatus elymi]QDP94862.1 FMN-binding glutamate synthase family protein [Microlunatus elymi]